MTYELITYKDKDTLFFVGHEVAEFLGYINQYGPVGRYVSENNKIKFKDLKSLIKIPEQDGKTVLINKTGVIELMEKTARPFTEKIKNCFEKYGIYTYFVNRNKNNNNNTKFIPDSKDIIVNNNLTVYSYIKDNIHYGYFIGAEINNLLGFNNNSKALRFVPEKNKLLFKDYIGIKEPSIDPRSILIDKDAVELLYSKYDGELDIFKYFNIIKKNKIVNVDEEKVDNSDINIQENINEKNDNLDTNIQENIKEKNDNLDTNIQENINEINSNINVYSDYFVANQIAPLLGYNSSITSYVSSENKIKFNDYKGVKEPKLNARTILINRNGIREILLKTKKSINDEIKKFIEKYNIEIENEGEKLILNDLTMYSYISNHLCFEYFVGYEIASLIGYSNTTQVIQSSVSKCNQLLFKDYPGTKEPLLDPKTILITRDGAIEILLKTRKMITPDVESFLKKFHIDLTNKKCLTKEQATLSEILKVFKVEKIEVQYPVGKYNVDAYFPEYKFIVECDENNHNDRDPMNERIRAEYINSTLKIDNTHWIRYNPDEKDFEISKVYREIYLMIVRLKDNIPFMKTCTKCLESKMSTLFDNDKNSGDNKHNSCKDCDRIYGERKRQKKKLLKEQEEQKDENKEEVIITKKKCIKCELDLDLDNFHKCSNIKDGYRNECIDCYKLRKKKITEMKKEIPLTKICSHCNEQKSSSDFYKRATSLDGLYGRCKKCMSNWEKQNKKQKKQNN